MIEVGFATLHDTIFVGGKNLSNKLDTKQYPQLKLRYDQENKELQVTWNKETSYVPYTNIKQYTPGKPLDRKITQPSSPMVANVSSQAQIEDPTGIIKATAAQPFTAQVETPMSHVHQGPGRGRRREVK